MRGHIPCRGPLARLVMTLFDQLTLRQGFDEQFLAMITDSDRARSMEVELKKLRREEESLAREQKNILDGMVQLYASESSPHKTAGKPGSNSPEILNE